MPELSILIVTYKVRHFLEHCLSSVSQAVSGLSHEIFVVDNNSGDGTAELFETERPNLTFIANTGNLGFSKANNQALSRARGKYILLINPDTVVQKDTFSTMIRFMEEHSDAGAAGCKILNPDGTFQSSCRRGFPTPLASLFKLSGLSRLLPRTRLAGAYHLSHLDPDEGGEVDALSGSFMMIRQEVLEKVGTLDEDFFMYGEDLDWCYRIKQAGMKIYYVPETQIIHFKGESSRSRGFRNLWSFYHAMHIFVRKHYRPRYFLFGDRLLSLGIILKAGSDYLGRWLRRFRSMFLDLFIMNGVLLLALMYRFGGLEPLPPYNDYRTYVVIHAFVTLVWSVAFQVCRMYTGVRLSPLKSTYGVSLGFVAISSATFFFKGFAYSRLAVLYAWGAGVVLLAFWRLAVRGIRFQPSGSRRIFILGTPETSAALLERLEKNFPGAYHVAGLIDDDEANLTRNIGGYRVVGTTEQLPRLIGEFDIREVLVAPLAVPYEKIVRLMSVLQKSQTQIKLVSESYTTIISKPQIQTAHDIDRINLS